MIKMKVTGVTIDPLTNMPFIILKDEEEKIAIPIWIGLIEASSIATKLEGIPLTRPMTHDLVINIFKEIGVVVEKAEISDVKENTYYALLYLKQKGKSFAIDCRPSDAVSLAIRSEAPIFVAKKVIESSRQIDLTKKTKKDKKTKDKWAEILGNLSPDDFGKYKM